MVSPIRKINCIDVGDMLTHNLQYPLSTNNKSKENAYV